MHSSDIVRTYLQQNEDVASCLKKGFLNYSRVARHIQETNKQASFHAIIKSLIRHYEYYKKQHLSHLGRQP